MTKMLAMARVFLKANSKMLSPSLKAFILSLGTYLAAGIANIVGHKGLAR